MIKYFFIFSVFFSLLSCDQLTDNEIASTDLISEKSNIVVSIKNVNKFKGSIKNNVYLNNITQSDSFIKNLFNTINKIDSNSDILIALYMVDNLMYYDIIGKDIITEDFENTYIYKDFEIISNNSDYQTSLNKNHFSKKFKKISLTNNNFSVMLDKNSTTSLLTKIFDKKFEGLNSSSIFNIDATNNLLKINGVVDNFNLGITKDSFEIQEIINSERGVFFNEEDLLNEYDLINTNQEKNFEIFNFIDPEKTFNNFQIFQLNKDGMTTTVNGLISQFKNESDENKTETKYKIRFPNNLVFGPVIVKNHINNKNEVIVQDSENVMHLINNDGQIEWSKKIDNKVIQKIEQIDSYKNGRLQYVFTTKNSLYLLDRQGRDVGKFPLKFRDEVTKPISVFDYDNNYNYRLLLTQNEDLIMFDSKGKRVKGFEYKKRGGISTNPKHFRISNKDIITFKADNKLIILNRRGKIRIKTEKGFKYSNHEIIQNENDLVTTTSNNEIVKIDMKGNIRLENKSIYNLRLTGNKQSLFTLQKNILSNSKKNIELKFGVFDEFKLFNYENKVFINIFDSQNNSIYAFDNNLNLIKGFPKSSIFNGDFDISNNDIEFSFISENNQLEYHLIK